MSDAACPELGVVVIGRNEGERLLRSLRSVLGLAACVVYVDSGSTDGSVHAARQLGAVVVELDMSQPFSAARARNEGFAELEHACPGLRYLQFVDGDCEISPGWIPRAVAELDRRPDLAVVCGWLRERFPDASIYNRLCDMEWNAQAGEIEACGGVAAYRADIFRLVGGFDPTIVAGEEPELCGRIRQQGYKIVRLEADMARHDAAMARFGQYWKRQIRTGYGGLDVVTRFANARNGAFAKQIRSSRIWGIGWPLAVLTGGSIAALAAGGRVGAVVALVVFSAGPLQVARLAIRTFRRGSGSRVALGYAVLSLISKWAQVYGQLTYLRDRRSGRHARLIEYRAISSAPLGTTRV